MNDIKYGKITDFVHFLIKNSYERLDNLTAIDATAGNGNDTLFLCRLCQNDGFVYAFDVQDKAIHNTDELLKKNECINYRLILDSHENIDKYMGATGHAEDEKIIKSSKEEPSRHKNIDICVFNLGYLPDDNKKVITRYESSISAIQKVINLLSNRGRVYVSAYINHDHGEEASHILEYLTKLDKRLYNVMQVKLVNKENCPPEIYIIEKKDA